MQDPNADRLDLLGMSRPGGRSSHANYGGYGTGKCGTTGHSDNSHLPLSFSEALVLVLVEAGLLRSGQGIGQRAGDLQPPAGARWAIGGVRAIDSRKRATPSTDVAGTEPERTINDLAVQSERAAASCPRNCPKNDQIWGSTGPTKPDCP